MRLLSNGVFVAIAAHGLIGISLIWDKVLLEKPATKDLANYVFLLGAMSILGVLLIPFGFRLPSAAMAGLGIGAGIVHLAANWFYYSALKLGEASETLAVMGGFAPLATALIAMPLLSEPFGEGGLPAFALMVAGGFVMFAAEKLNWRKVLPSVLISAFLFGITNDLQKVVFNNTGFVTGYVFFTMGTFLGSLGLLIRPLWRRQIFLHSREAPPKSRFWYFLNRFISGVGSFLIFVAISRSNPSTVSAIAGVRYVIIFLGAYALATLKPVWLSEDFRRGMLIAKALATALIVAGLALAGLNRGHSGSGGSAHSFLPPYRSCACQATQARLAQPARRDSGSASELCRPLTVLGLAG